MAEILYELAAEILKNLGSLAVQEVESIRGLGEELRKLSGTVSSIQAVLMDAEEQQQSSHEVRDWIRKLKKVFFEADDLLDDFATEVTHRKLVSKNCPLLDLSDEEAMQFEVPGNLSTFKAFYLDKLMSLPVWLQHFSGTLKSIEIWECPNLTTIPEWIGGLIALNWLEIYGSRMLTSFPEGMRSLAAMQVLIVTRCSSILKQRCEKEGGEDWPKIAHIPRVDIREGI